MHKVRVTKQFSFEMAHALDGHDGQCRHIHGHSYYLSVTVSGSPIQDSSSPKNGMVVDFADLKAIVKRTILDHLDHSLVLFKKSEFIGQVKSWTGHKVVLTPYNPTCENLVIDFAKRIRKELPQDTKLHRLLLRETQTGYAEWYASDNE